MARGQKYFKHKIVTVFRSFAHVAVFPNYEINCHDQNQNIHMYISCSFSPPAADYASVVNYQFWKLIFPCWLMASWERVDCSWHHCHSGITGSATRAGTGCTDLQLITCCVATARHWPDPHVQIAWVQNIQLNNSLFTTVSIVIVIVFFSQIWV